MYIISLKYGTKRQLKKVGYIDMACYAPLLGIPYPASHPKYGQYRIVGNATDSHIVQYATDPSTGQYLEGIRIPCGRCIGCRLDKSREWATRLQCEALDYPESSNWFVTLTYAQPDDSLDLPSYGRFASVNDDGALTLNKQHPTDWLKRLREHHARKVSYDYDPPTYYDSRTGKVRPLGIRYFLAGEYGDRTMRPHYHVIMLNCPLPDLRQIGRNKLGMPLYTSDLMTETWGYGHVTIGRMTWQTAAYVARYTLKKANGQTDEQYEQLGLTPEYTVMSRMPGIGHEYLLRHSNDIYTDDEVVLPALSKDKPNVQRPPKYFDRVYQAIDPKTVAKVKSRRAEVAQIMQAEKLAKTDLDEAAYLTLAEKATSERVKKLIRDL